MRPTRPDLRKAMENPSPELLEYLKELEAKKLEEGKARVRHLEQKPTGEYIILGDKNINQ